MDDSVSGPLQRLSVTIHGLVAEHFAKKLLGDSEIENILRRLDRLTQDEARMEAHILEVVHGHMNNMKVVMDGEQNSFFDSEHRMDYCLCRRRDINRRDPENSRYVQFSLMTQFSHSLRSPVTMQEVISKINKMDRMLSHPVYLYPNS